MTTITPAGHGSHPPLIPLHHAHDIQRCGTKAATLARLAAAGMPVPAGLVVPTDLPNDQLHPAAHHLSTWARDRAPYGLITRSSTATEDGPRASFAGLHHSHFTPTNPDPLQRALHAVRSSPASATAHAYARHHGIPTDHQPPAVLVQPALRPHTSGVLGAQTTNDRATRWHIQATHGLSQALLAGSQMGDIYASGPTGEVTTIGDQSLFYLPASPAELDIPPGEWITLPTPNGHNARAKLATSDEALLHLRRPTAWHHQPALTPGHRDRLLHAAETAATVLAFDGIEIEWAIDTTDHLWLLQARPLTAPLPDPQPPTMPPDNAWHGIPASPGTGHGNAIHLTDNPTPDTATGNVLICGPLGADAVPALLTHPAAVISTTGGPLSHTAIIARELGIPCVTAVTNALTIPPGTHLHVNGTTGTITHTNSTPVTPP